MLQLSFRSPKKMVVILFLPTNLDLLVMWNLSQVKYLPLDAVKESKEPGDDGRQLSPAPSVCSILMGSPDTDKSIMEEAPKQMSPRWIRLAWPMSVRDQDLDIYLQFSLNQFTCIFGFQLLSSVWVLLNQLHWLSECLKTQLVWGFQ